MAFKTINGFDPTGGTNPVGTPGTKDFASGPLSSADLKNSFRDTLNAGIYQLAAGVLVGGVCTVSGLVVTVPSGTVYFAQQTWQGTSDTTISVPDNSTSYVWGCSDGVLRLTSSTTPPLGFVRAQCALLVKATAVSGVVTLDLTVQDDARYVDNTNRVVYEYNAQIGMGWQSEMDTIPTGVSVVIPAGYQQTLFDSLTVYGTLTIYGRLRVTL